MGCTEERLGSGGAPVDEQLLARIAEQAGTPHVHRLVRVDRDKPPQTQIGTVTTQLAQSPVQSLNLEITFHHLLSHPPG
jgi:hypothetical protein